MASIYIIPHVAMTVTLIDDQRCKITWRPPARFYAAGYYLETEGLPLPECTGPFCREDIPSLLDDIGFVFACHGTDAFTS